MDREIYKNNNTRNSAPTVATQTVFMVAAIAAAEHRAVAAVDVPGAFLKADMPTDGPPVLMRLDKFLTSVLVELDPSYQQFVRKDGTCIVQLTKALYGTVQAAKCTLRHGTTKFQLTSLGSGSLSTRPTFAVSIV